MVEVTCKLCGKKSLVKPSYVKNGWGKYCSHRCCMKDVMTGRKFNKEHRQKLSLAKEGKRSPRLGVKCSPETVAKVSLAAKNMWQNDIYVRRQMKARSVRPNESEKLLQFLLDRFFPNEWSYVGDGEVIIQGKCPDFINVNGKKLIIELFGNYWHKKEEVEPRKEIFARYGYKTLIIWESELNNLSELEGKLGEFTRTL